MDMLSIINSFVSVMADEKKNFENTQNIVNNNEIAVQNIIDELNAKEQAYALKLISKFASDCCLKVSSHS